MFVPLGMRKFSALLTAFMATAVSEMALSQMAAPVMAGTGCNERFPQQTIVWDASAIENTFEALIEEQSPLRPWRTKDIANGFGSSLSVEQGRPSAQLEIPLVTPLW